MKKYNRSYIYVLPMLGESYLQFVKKDPKNTKERILKNTYLFSEYMPDYKEHIFLEYKKIDYLKPVYDWFEMNNLFVDKYETEEDDVEVFCFKIPHNQLDNLNNFKASKYSKFEDSYKRHILKFHNEKLDSIISKILYKDESLYIQRELELDCAFIDRNQEVGEFIDLNLETHKKKIDLKPNNKQTVIWD